jgi:hypothetical protein
MTGERRNVSSRAKSVAKEVRNALSARANHSVSRFVISMVVATPTGVRRATSEGVPYRRDDLDRPESRAGSKDKLREWRLHRVIWVCDTGFLKQRGEPHLPAARRRSLHHRREAPPGHRQPRRAGTSGPLPGRRRRPARQGGVGRGGRNAPAVRGLPQPR